MVQFVLPPDSKVRPGKRYEPLSDQPFKRFHIYRYDPHTKENPRIDSFPVSYQSSMILDGLIEIKKNFDRTLSFRRSCCEGICGSCAMNINGVNTLACITPLKTFSKDVIIYPLPHMQVVKDLIPDLTHAFGQYAASQPWLQNKTPSSPYQERVQTPQEREALEGLWECILCFCCTTSCPSYWWNGEDYLGPAVLLQAQRWLADTRDEATQERLDFLEDKFKLYRCHTILNCAKACPKKLNPAQAISAIKRALAKRHL